MYPAFWLFWFYLHNGPVLLLLWYTVQVENKVENSDSIQYTYVLVVLIHYCVSVYTVHSVYCVLYNVLFVYNIKLLLFNTVYIAL